MRNTHCKNVRARTHIHTQTRLQHTSRCKALNDCTNDVQMVDNVPRNIRCSPSVPSHPNFATRSCTADADYVVNTCPRLAASVFTKYSGLVFYARIDDCCVCVCVYVVRGPAGTTVSRRCVLQNLSVFDDGWWGIFHLDWLKVVTQTIRHLICVFVCVFGAVACRVTIIYEMLSLKCDFMLLCIADLAVGFFLFFSVNHALHICTVVNKYKCMQEI